MNVWLLLICMGLVTYAIRLSMIGLIGRVNLPSVVQWALCLVPPAVLSAIIFPELLMPKGTLDLSFGNLDTKIIEFLFDFCLGNIIDLILVNNVLLKFIPIMAADPIWQLGYSTGAIWQLVHCPFIKYNFLFYFYVLHPILFIATELGPFGNIFY